MRRKIAVTGSLVAAAAASVALASPAMAATDAAWSSNLGPNGYGCFAYTTYTSTIVTPHIWEQPGAGGDNCTLEVEHVGYNADGSLGYTYWWGPNTTAGPSTVVDGPSWYYGSWNGNGWMCVRIYVSDYNGDYGSNGNYTEVC
jgi:hypothetical protein